MSAKTNRVLTLEERLEQLAVTFPECLVDGQMNGRILRKALSEAGILKDESYGLVWPGKSEAKDIAAEASTKTLRRTRKGKHESTTNNLYIEGDNLEALKILCRTYSRQIKCIYIDPPYNTGNDFVYNDKFTMSPAAYRQERGVLEQAAGDSSERGRHHAGWLNMIYPRLQVAQELLRDDGVIFISIDDHEYANLKNVCDEIFGEANFVASFVWTTKTAAKGVPPTTMLVSNHEYILCYSKAVGGFRFKGIPRSDAAFSNPDNDPRGPWKADNMKSTVRTAKVHAFTDPETGWRFEDKWAFSPEKIQTMIEEGRIIFPRKRTGQPRQKKFFTAYKNPNTPIKSVLGVYHTETATNRLKSTLDCAEKVFDFPKPVELVRLLLAQSTEGNDIILDFFSGSGTTGHATIKQNSLDGCNRRFILVQLATNVDRGGFATIPEIAMHRLRNVEDELESRHPDWSGDVGFCTFDMTDSHD